VFQLTVQINRRVKALVHAKEQKERANEQKGKNISSCTKYMEEYYKRENIHIMARKSSGQHFEAYLLRSRRLESQNCKARRLQSQVYNFLALGGKRATGSMIRGYPGPPHIDMCAQARGSEPVKQRAMGTIVR
jgi:hypothetical protein